MPPSGPTSFLMELLLLLADVEDDDADPELSVQYASRNEGLLSVNVVFVVAELLALALESDCANTTLFSIIELS